MNKEIRVHQIEELLLNAHLEREGGIDLIDEYFEMNSSLDRVTELAKDLLNREGGQETQKAVMKNLAECIVVKNQRDQQSLFGVAKRYLQKFGLFQGKGGEIQRAENLLSSYRKKM